MSLVAQIEKIEEIDDEETRMEAINHSFSSKSSMDRFSYGGILAFLGSVDAGLLCTFVTLIHQNANFFSLFANLLIMTGISLNFLFLYLHTIGLQKKRSDYYIVILDDLIIQRQGVP